MRALTSSATPSANGSCTSSDSTMMIPLWRSAPRKTSSPKARRKFSSPTKSSSGESPFHW